MICLMALGLLFAPVLSVPGVGDAVQLYERGEFQQAATLLSQSNHAPAEKANAQLWLGKSYLKLHKWDEAIEEVGKAVLLEPSNALYHYWLGRAYGEKAARSSILTAFGWARKVLQEFKTGLGLAPQDMEVRFALLEYYLDAPGVVGGGKDKAEALIKEINLQNPRMGYKARALLYQKEKKWVQARQECVKATMEFPSEPEVWLDLARFLFDREEYEGAALNARKALELKVRYPEAELVLMKSEIRRGSDLTDVQNRLKQLASGPLGDDDPTFDDVYYWLGQAYLAGDKKVEARRAFETALRYNPEHSEARKALSRIS